MKAMILAAGQGTRVRPITLTTPKPMMPLINKPVLESIIELLGRHGVDDIVINTSHLAPVIEDYFRDGGRWDVSLSYSFEGHIENGRIRAAALGSAGGMRKVQDFSGFFDETFIVMCGDALVDLDIGAALQFHRKARALATIVMQDVPPDQVSKYGVVATDAQGRIRQFQEKPAPDAAVSTTVNTGIYIFEPEIFEHIPAGTEYDIGSQLFPDLVEKQLPFYGVTLPFQWLDIGSIGDYWRGTRRLLRGEFHGYPLPGRAIEPGIRCGSNVRMNRRAVTLHGPVYIGSGCSIGDGVEIQGPTVIGANSVIEAGARISESILGHYSYLSSVARLERKLFIDGHCIQPDGVFVDTARAELGWLLGDARQKIELDPAQHLLVRLASQAA
jgi:mannose-1-phosphate guanylyltransferase